MLPFLAKRKQANVTVYQAKDDGSKEQVPEASEELKNCAEKLIQAVHAKDATALAEVLKTIIKE